MMSNKASINPIPNPIYNFTRRRAMIRLTHVEDGKDADKQNQLAYSLGLSATMIGSFIYFFNLYSSRIVLHSDTWSNIIDAGLRYGIATTILLIFIIAASLFTRG